MASIWTCVSRLSVVGWCGCMLPVMCFIRMFVAGNNYAQVTTIRRYGGNTTRSRIPIGSFYGHTFIFPWEKEVSSVQTEDALEPGSHSVILSQLNIYTALLEEVQCRYSLACKNLVTLLSAAENISPGQAHYLQFFLKRGKRTDDDNHIIQAYHECCQLQVIIMFSLFSCFSLALVCQHLNIIIMSLLRMRAAQNTKNKTKKQ